MSFLSFAEQKGLIHCKKQHKSRKIHSTLFFFEATQYHYVRNRLQHPIHEQIIFTELIQPVDKSGLNGSFMNQTDPVLQDIE